MASAFMFGAVSCSDMLEADSSRLVTDPAMNSKTDSMFYANGILEAVQQLADQYFFQNEMRGELVTPTSKATTHLQNLSNFTAGAENKYDSVYLYYKVINNCNYYLNKRDTTLMTGSNKVTINEFAAIAAFRGWTYLQLTSQYGNVPYITDPVTSISQINATTSTTDYKQILASEAEYMQALKNRYPAELLDAPVYAGYNNAVLMGSPNWSSGQISYITRMLFVPFNVVLGDLYLEIGEYQKAAMCYYDYLNHKVESDAGGVTSIANSMSNKRSPRDSRSMEEFEMPLDYNTTSGNSSLSNDKDMWDKNFGSGTSVEQITYIPMAVNYTRGVTTEVPQAFGYDYYATSREKNISSYNLGGCPQLRDIQVVPSAEYNEMAFKAPYYYYSTMQDPTSKTTRYLITSTNIGDGRANMIVHGTEDADSSLVFVQKPSNAVFSVYRNTTVYLHLAEALNRLNEPELAFAILKSGLHAGLEAYVDTAAYVYQDGVLQYDDEDKTIPTVKDKGIPVNHYYIPKPSFQKLKGGSNLPPFFGEASKVNFTNTSRKEIVGVHFHGAGAVEDVRSPYTYYPIVIERINAIRQKFGVGEDDPSTEEYVNAVEDLLCDEYALEFAFEGRRFSDLLRLARHKNESTVYGPGFGDTWLSSKLAKKAAGITTHNCYLPFK